MLIYTCTRYLCEGACLRAVFSFNLIIRNLWPVLHSLTDCGPTHLNLKISLMVVEFIIFNPDHHYNRTEHELFTRKGDKNGVFWWSVSLACFNKLYVDYYLYIFFKIFFILLSEKEKAATRQWKSCQKIQGIQILIEYMTHFHC